MTAPTSKAHAFTAVCDVAKEMMSPEKWLAVQASAPADVRALIVKPELPMHRIPARCVSDLLYEVLRVGFDGDHDQLTELARRQMRRDMSGIYRILIKVASLDAIIRKAASIYSAYTDNGQMMAERVSPTLTRVSLAGVSESGPAYWSYQRGCILGVLEAAGHKVQVTLVRGGGDAPNGDFDVLQLAE